MSISREEIMTLKCRIDLTEFIGQPLRKVANTNGGEFAGPCPFCAGTDRFHMQPHAKEGGRWFCRQCTGEPTTEGWRDIFDYLMQRDRITFFEAYRQLADTVPSRAWPTDGPPTTSAPTAESPSKAHGDQPWRTPEWQAETWQAVEHATWQLENDAKAAESRDYLHQRGLVPQTWQAWQLGHVVAWNPNAQQKMNAIALPWHDGPTVSAVQYRFTGTELEKKARYGQRPGGDRKLFGLHLLTGQETLVLVEGELNAISIWQEARGLPLDVVSWGPQANIARPEVAELTAELIGHGFQRILLWADEFAASVKALSALHEAGAEMQHVTLIASPNGLDANELLLQNELTDFLTQFVKIS